jgi:hypothetical protein
VSQYYRGEVARPPVSFRRPAETGEGGREEAESPEPEVTSSQVRPPQLRAGLRIWNSKVRILLINYIFIFMSTVYANELYQVSVNSLESY